VSEAHGDGSKRTAIEVLEAHETLTLRRLKELLPEHFDDLDLEFTEEIETNCRYDRLLKRQRLEIEAFRSGFQ